MITPLLQLDCLPDVAAVSNVVVATRQRRPSSRGEGGGDHIRVVVLAPPDEPPVTNPEQGDVRVAIGAAAPSCALTAVLGHDSAVRQLPVHDDIGQAEL